MAAQVVDALPDGDDWLYEVKFDGYRALIVKNGDRIEIRSRNDKDLTAAYPGIRRPRKLHGRKPRSTAKSSPSTATAGRRSRRCSTGPRIPVTSSFSMRSICCTWTDAT